ncbi:hypothetical protein BDW42DRAFT_131681 [Aspergillus taichungensis]|uniref:Uncharacterized protein n=1 Tax=Aspergillus taichungensis TaxID=482145 RepID=A0A2J5I702_9EURO|nr:hypothetical protein BDW42DRAFT_131681 [Aspergillus taichungensis]
MGVTGTVKYIFHLPTRTKHLARSPSSSSTPRKEKTPEYIKSSSIQVTLKGPDKVDQPRTRHGAVSFQELQPPPHSRHYRQTSCIPSSSGTSGRGSSSSKGKVAMTTAAKKGRPAAVRAVSWASIVGDRPRWTEEQERELEIAEVELRRCQKAWSSEQEVWLARIEVLNEEKEAHEDFLHSRARQQDDEQQLFRKVWSQRKSIDDPLQRQPSQRFRRLRRSLDGADEEEDPMTLAKWGGAGGLRRLRRTW